MIEILVVEDNKELQEAIKLTLDGFPHISYKITDTVEKAMHFLSTFNYDIVLSDKKLPDGDGMDILTYIKNENLDTCFILMTAYPDNQSIKEAIEKGIFYYLTKPFKKFELEIVLRLAIENVKLKKEVEYLKEKDAAYKDDYLLEGGSLFKNLLDTVVKVAKSDTNCLILGESGVGKEVISKVIHTFSPRKDNPFVVVNCPAISPSLFESELFGHEKGSFTGATSLKKGKFEMANSGTILLDEVTEIPIELQSKLLRVIQEKTIERVGSLMPIRVDVRIIATTNRNIDKMVKDGKFREDLYHRLNVVRIEVPPLRNRLDDLDILVEFLSSKISKRCGFKAKTFTKDAITYMKSYPWPGNIRELANFIERVYVLENQTTITEAIIKKYLGWERQQSDSSFENLKILSPQNLTLPTLNINSLEKIAIETALKMCNFNKSKAAHLLGITERTLRNKLKHYKTLTASTNMDKSVSETFSGNF